MRPLAPLILAVLTLTACGGSDTPTQTEDPALTVAVQPSPARVGQELSFKLDLSGTAETWNVALFVEDPEGNIDQLLPNRTGDGSSTLRDGTTWVFPDDQSKLLLKASAPAGVHTILAYASPKPLDLSAISTYRDGQVFATVNENRQGKGSLETSFLAILKLYNPGTQALTTFNIVP